MFWSFTNHVGYSAANCSIVFSTIGKKDAVRHPVRETGGERRGTRRGLIPTIYLPINRRSNSFLRQPHRVVRKGPQPPVKYPRVLTTTEQRYNRLSILPNLCKACRQCGQNSYACSPSRKCFSIIHFSLRGERTFSPSAYPKRRRTSSRLMMTLSSKTAEPSSLDSTVIWLP